MAKNVVGWSDQRSTQMKTNIVDLYTDFFSSGFWFQLNKVSESSIVKTNYTEKSLFCKTEIEFTLILFIFSFPFSFPVFYW